MYNILIKIREWGLGIGVDDEQPTYDLMNYIIGLTAALPDDFGPVIEGLADQAG